MKKITLIASALALVSILAFTACDSDTNAGEDTTPETTETTAAATEADTPAATEPVTTQPETEASTKITYKVTVVDQNGDAVEEAYVQICTDETCFMPEVTAADGTVTFSLEDGVTYKAKLAGLPDGYTGSEDYVNFPADSTELTITVTKN